jgi:predicted acyl esterase
VSNLTGTRPRSFRIDVVDNMTIEWDVPIKISDGVVLSADVFRPTAPGVYPTILSYGALRQGITVPKRFSGFLATNSRQSSRRRRRVEQPVSGL